ncbi:MAG: ABC transporter ATP-binding protein [Gammaproteobacteria bacterium]|nr:ABC transporter ATP-binding protein [Gammaproteobacteria bacterium]
MTPESTDPARYTWRDLLELALAHKPRLVRAHAVAIVAAVLSVPVPLLMPLLVDEVLLHHPGRLVAMLDRFLPQAWQGPLAYLGVVLAATILLRMASLVLQVWQARDFALIAKEIIFRMRERLLGRLQRVSMAEYEALGGATVSSHLIVDLGTIDQFTGDTLNRFMVGVLTLIGAAAVLLWMNWQLGLFLLVMNPVAVYFTVAIGKKVRELKRRENAALQAFQEALTETLEAIHQLRAANRDRHYLARVTDLADHIRTHAAAYSWRSDAANRLSFTVFLVGIDVFRTAAMVIVLISDLSIGQMIAVFGYLWYMLGPIDTILNLQFQLQAATAALDRVNRLVKLDEEPAYPHLRDPFTGRRANALSLKGIRFRYGDGPLILDDVDLEIAAGEHVAFVGASGGGKSTLVQVILGLYPAEAGELCFDSVPVQEIGLDVVRSHVGTVLQHPALLNDTVRNNLTLGAEVDEARLWKVLEVAQLAAFVAGMAEGLGTIIGRDGVRLSGGQRQRLAIARMLLTEPNVVILDEATSALDVDTERRVHEALGRYLRGRTLLVIAHRLSAVKEADRVYVFDSGRIVQEGPHQALISADGFYQRLYGQAGA